MAKRVFSGSHLQVQMSCAPEHKLKYGSASKRGRAVVLNRSRFSYFLSWLPGASS